MSYIALRCCWSNIIVLNVHAPSEEKSDDSKDSFYGELEQVFDRFPKYHTKIILGFLMQQWGERIFSNRLYGMKVYIRIAMIVGLEQ